MTTGRKPSAELLRVLLDRAPDVVMRARLVPDRAFEYVNEAVTRITGYTPEEFYADPELGQKLAHPDDRAVLLELLRTGWKPGPHVVRWRRKDGELIWIEQRTVSVYDDGGQLVAIEGIARQISDPTTGTAPAIRTCGGVRIDLFERRVYVDGHEVHLTAAEFKLLVLLTDNPGHTITRAQMMRRLWRSSHTGDGHTCEAHISNLRKKLEPEKTSVRRIVTERGKGYRFSDSA